MTPPAPSRDAVVAAARESIAKGSKSFAAASKLFDPQTRERAWLLYAWCRACDDIADGQELGHDARVVEDPAAALARIRTLTDKALAGAPTGEMAFEALRIVAAETRMPHRFAHDLVAGFALDAKGWFPRSEHDLMQYCYHVAGAVGCMMAVVMGVDPDDDATLDRACDLGLAFQLANIARDIEADDAIGRCYLPMDWLVEMDIPPGQHMKPPFRSRLTVMARWLGELAQAHEESARLGTPALGFRSAWAVLAAAGIYGGIAREVVARGDHAWDHRASTSKAQKIGWIARAYGQSLARRNLYPPRPRAAELWTRPR
ncbi:phytoene/squalene synthase family protein [Sphingomonas sp. R647]|uniref:phytoene/squalene synthase family protein n=1 Tax=Sphingomonas sp. R647 TaxID=2875233 RepID=UPI001CD50C41|nr:phytoene/squalene synthase family protein [Sphingomonas sp. R647]MCA1198742.1 phytoene/squalene synthase family protein [Sphingomonas sp. R647]